MKVIAEQDIICYQNMKCVEKNLQRKLVLWEILSTFHTDNPKYEKNALGECSCKITDFEYKQVPRNILNYLKGYQFSLKCTDL